MSVYREAKWVGKLVMVPVRWNALIVRSQGKCPMTWISTVYHVSNNCLPTMRTAYSRGRLSPRTKKALYKDDCSFWITQIALLSNSIDPTLIKVILSPDDILWCRLCGQHTFKGCMWNPTRCGFVHLCSALATKRCMK